MKTICQIAVFDDDVDEKCFAELARLSPGSMLEDENEIYRFFLEVDDGDPLIPGVLGVLQSRGMKMPKNPQQAGSTGIIGLHYVREFDETDYASAEYLQIVGNTSLVLEKSLHLKRLEIHSPEPTGCDPGQHAGAYFIDAGDLDKHRITSMRDQVVVVEKVKSLLSAQDFRGLSFREGEPIHDPDGYEGFIWELQSSLFLPALSPTCELYEFNDPEDPKERCRDINDGMRLPLQLCYRASDLRAAESFDIARTREGLGWGLCDHPLVVSQRFHQFCTQHNLNLPYIPVRVLSD